VVRQDPRLIAGFERAEDAGVYKLSDDLAIIQTVDFFTPILDDPFEFGQVAAANALSDVYAMGGTPITAMNIVCYPCSLGMDVLRDILRGGASKVAESGALLVGGHSVDDKEPKYGLSVTGVVHPDRVVLNSGARPGDLIVLTKPLGTGIISTALRAGAAPPECEQTAFRVMSLLNAGASRVMQEVGVHACTDITGFGLLGHLFEMVSASGVSAKVFGPEVPVIEFTLELASRGFVPGGSRRNRKHFEPHVDLGGVEPDLAEVLFDAQTSGGLLIAVASDRAGDLVMRLREEGTAAASVIGEIREPGPRGAWIDVVPETRPGG
jgi:selenide,water dikinase